MRAVGVVVSEADLPVLSYLALYRQVGLLRERILKILRNWNREWQQRQGESCCYEILIRKNGIRLKRIESLLIRLIAHDERKSGRHWRATGERSACAGQQTLKNICCVQCKGIQIRETTCSRARRASGGLKKRGSGSVLGGRQKRESQRWMVVEESVASAYDGLAVAPRVPRDADPGRNVVRIGWNSLDNAKSLFSGRIQSR